ncbi:MAG: hypothetical protein KKB36_09610, partial [Gammaproteobacteria bacterium]|nr:hypothetical protein [Gammaproteobacteria bacterium]
MVLPPVECVAADTVNEPHKGTAEEPRLQTQQKQLEVLMKMVKSTLAVLTTAAVLGVSSFAQA